MKSGVSISIIQLIGLRVFVCFGNGAEIVFNNSPKVFPSKINFFSFVIQFSFDFDRGPNREGRNWWRVEWKVI